MQRYDHLIIGVGIAGVTAAETLIGADPELKVALIGDEPYRLYSRVLLPRYVDAKLERERVFLRKEGQLEDKGIELLTGARVVKVDPAARVVTLDDGREFGYGKLLIATGGRARKLPCPGGDEPDIDHFQTLDDADALRAAKGEFAAVVGSGFIGLELAMAYVRLGLSPTVFLRRHGFFSRALDPASIERVHMTLERNGVALRTGTEVIGVERTDAGFSLSLSDKTTFDCARLGVGIGLEMNVDFLEGSGIATGAGVIVDATLATDRPDVFAAGDVAEFPDPVAGRRRTVGNWQNALFQGKHAASGMRGNVAPFSQLTSYSISCFDMPIAFLGAVDGEFDARAVQVSDSAVLQLCRAEDRIIGASCVGTFSERAAVTALISARTPVDEEQLKRFESGEKLSTLFPQ